MNCLFIKTFIVALSLSFAVHATAQEFKLEGSFSTVVYNSRKLTLIRLSDDSIAWTGKAGINGDFSIMAKSGDYALCIYDDLPPLHIKNGIYNESIIPVKLTSDTDLGQILLTSLSYDSIYELVVYVVESFGHTSKVTNDKFKKELGIRCEWQGKIARTVFNSPIRKYDMKTVFNFLLFADRNYRIDETANYAPKIEINGRPVDMNFIERMNLLKDMRAKDVKYFETEPPSEASRGGIIRIVSTDYAESGTLPKGFYRVRGQLSHPIFMFLVQDNTNTIVWSSDGAFESSDPEFFINIEKGDYILCIPYSPYTDLYIPVHVDSDIDLGLLSEGAIPVEISDNFDDIIDKLKMQSFPDGREKRTPGPAFKNYDMLTLLRGSRITTYFVGFKSDKVATIRINGVAIEKNFSDLISYLQSLPAKDVEYVEIFNNRAEESLRGTINIVTAPAK